jgi:bifunctional DNA-binding transcriptional regulator/antitoxin component of YhaV-PrlF toxin-antitoxin module
VTTELPVETEVGDDGTVTVPPPIRRELDIEPGDVLRWNTDESCGLSVEVVRQREGAFDGFDPVDAGETNAVEAERDFGSE